MSFDATISPLHLVCLYSHRYLYHAETVKLDVLWACSRTIPTTSSGISAGISAGIFPIEKFGTEKTVKNRPKRRTIRATIDSNVHLTRLCLIHQHSVRLYSIWLVELTLSITSLFLFQSTDWLIDWLIDGLIGWWPFVCLGVWLISIYFCCVVFCRVNGEHPQDILAKNRWHVSHSLT